MQVLQVQNDDIGGVCRRCTGSCRREVQVANQSSMVRRFPATTILSPCCRPVSRLDCRSWSSSSLSSMEMVIGN